MYQMSQIRESFLALNDSPDSSQFDALIVDIHKTMRKPNGLYAIDGEKCTLLHFASAMGHVPTIKALLDQGAEADADNAQGYKALHAHNTDGNTPLHIAVLYKQFSAVELLLAGGANINMKGDQGDTALHIATQAENFKIVHFLLYHGADYEAHNNLGETVLAIACEFGYSEILQLLLDEGANPNIRSRWGRLLDWTSRRPDRPEVMRALIEKGADIRALSMKSWCYLAQNSDALMSPLLHGADKFYPVKKDRLKSGTTIYKEVMEAKKHLYATLKYIFSQFNIEIDDQACSEIMRFFARIANWRYQHQSPQTLKDYFSRKNYPKALKFGKDIVWNMFQYFKFKKFPIELIEPMLIPLFQRQYQIIELMPHFKLTQKIIALLYDGLNDSESLIYQFQQAKLIHDWIAGEWRPADIEALTSRPSL